MSDREEEDVKREIRWTDADGNVCCSVDEDGNVALKTLPTSAES